MTLDGVSMFYRAENCGLTLLSCQIPAIFKNHIISPPDCSYSWKIYVMTFRKWLMLVWCITYILTGQGTQCCFVKNHGTRTEIRYQDWSALPWSKMATATISKDVYTAFLLFRIVFHMFDAGYRAIVSYCFYVIPESVIEFDKTAVNWCTKNT